MAPRHSDTKGNLMMSRTAAQTAAAGDAAPSTDSAAALKEVRRRFKQRGLARDTSEKGLSKQLLGQVLPAFLR